jgi:hypothetical protein
LGGARGREPHKSRVGGAALPRDPPYVFAPNRKQKIYTDGIIHIDPWEKTHGCEEDIDPHR